MEHHYYQTIGWVSSDGSWSAGNGLVIFDGDQLTEEQLDNLSNLSDNDRIDYVLAILNGEDTSDWEWED